MSALERIPEDVSAHLSQLLGLPFTPDKNAPDQWSYTLWVKASNQPRLRLQLNRLPDGLWLPRIEEAFDGLSDCKQPRLLGRQVPKPDSYTEAVSFLVTAWRRWIEEINSLAQTVKDNVWREPIARQVDGGLTRRTEGTFGAPCVAACDGVCARAFGREARPRVWFSTDPDDWAYVPDRLLPLPDSTKMEQAGRPTKYADKLHAWCLKSCERHESRSAGEQPFIRNFGEPVFNTSEQEQKWPPDAIVVALVELQKQPLRERKHPHVWAQMIDGQWVILFGALVDVGEELPPPKARVVCPHSASAAELLARCMKVLAEK